MFRQRILEKLRIGSFNQQQIIPVPKPENERDKKLIHVLGSYEITDYRLCTYLSQRKIPEELANKYCREVSYELYGKVYTAIGLKNDAGGYELRSPNFKGSSSPKDITLVDNGAKKVAVFEGFFSFLSYLVLHQNQHQPLTNFLVLNSLSLIKSSRNWAPFYSYQQQISHINLPGTQIVNTRIRTYYNSPKLHEPVTNLAYIAHR